MPEPKRPEKRKENKKRRRALKIVLWTMGLLVLLPVLLFGAALLTIDCWIVPLAARFAGVEVVGSPGVKVSIRKREIALTDLTVKCNAGIFAMRSCGLKLDDMKVSGWRLTELRVSQVYADGLRAELSFQPDADSPETQDEGPISGEKMRIFSHKMWDDASKPVVRIMELNLTDAEIRWQSGPSRNVVTLPSVQAAFEDGNLTRPNLVCDAGYRLDNGQCSVRFGTRLRASALNGVNSVIVTAAGKGPVTIDLPDSHFELPSSYMLAQYEPDDDVIRFGGEWGNSDRWDFAPLDLSLDNGLFETFGTLALEGEKLRLHIEANAQGSDLICGGGDIPGDVMFDAECGAVFDLATGGVTLDSLSGYLIGPNGGRLNLETAGAFEFVRHEDRTYSLVPQPARLTIRTGKPLDLSPFNAMLPFDSAGRILAAEYFIELDPEEVRLHGGTDIVVRDSRTMSPVFDANAVFETEGVTRISSFHVSDCGVSFYDDGDQICHALFTGEYNIRAAALKGEMTYSPYRMAETFGTQELADLYLFLNDANLSRAEHTVAADLDLDLIGMSAALRKESHLTRLGLNGTNGKNLELDTEGNARFRVDPDGGWQLECGLELNAGTDFRAGLHVSGGSDMVFSGNLNVAQLSDILAHQLARKFIPDSACDDLPLIRFVNASGSAAFRYDLPEARIVLSDLNGIMDEGCGYAALSCESGIVWTDGGFQFVPDGLTLKTVSLPVSLVDPLFGDTDDFRFAGGVLSSELDLSSDADGKMLRGTCKFVGSDLAYLVDGDPFEVAKIGGNAVFELDPETLFLVLPEINLDVHDRQARQTLFASGSGTVDLPDECRLRMMFPETRCGPEILYLIGFGAEHCFYFEELNAVGPIEFRADHLFSELSWEGGMKINRMRLYSDDPGKYRFEELSGRVDGIIIWADDDLFGDAAIHLSDEEGEEHFAARYLYRRGEDSLPKFVTSSLDLPFVLSYFRYNHNPDPGAESGETELFDETFELDLHGIYTRNHSMIFSAAGLLKVQEENPAIIVPHMRLSGDVFGVASGEIRVVGEENWPFDADLALSTIPLDKSYLAILASDENPEIPHELHGFIRHLKADIHGEGFSKEALRKKLRADCEAELENVSLRSSLRESSQFMNVLLLPLMSVPRLIDLVPGAMVRRVLRMATAGAVMDMISGEAPIEFKRGEMTLSVRQGVVDLKRLDLNGDVLEDYNVKGAVDIAGDGMAEIETVTRFAFFYWPIFLEGNILDPQVSFRKSIARFFEVNAKRLPLMGGGADVEVPEAEKKPEQ